MAQHASRPRTDPQRRRSHRVRIATCISIGFVAMSMSLSVADAEPVGTVISYEHTVNANLPPAANFSGSAGGDGWALAFNDTNVYNVFHHGDLKFACHAKATAAACSGSGYVGGTKSVVDGTNKFRTGMTPPVFIDSATNHMFTMVVKVPPSSATGTTGVVEIDLSSTSTNPFVAFYPLSRANEGACLTTCTTSGRTAIITNTAQVGTKWYVYNYVSGVANPALPDSRNKLLCFDLATKSACGGQPYAVETSGGVQARTWEVGNIGTVNNKIYVDIFDNSGNPSLDEIACVDVSSTPANCSGWPKAPVAKVNGVAVPAPPFPLLNSSGTAIGVCFPGDPNVCTDFDGVVQSIPAALANLANPENIPYASARSEAHVYGTRIYMPNVGPANNNTASVNNVSCYDYAIDDLCAGFPSPFKSFTTSALSGLYSIQSDPAYPTCIWVNANAGTAQIQNFDYETGGVCGAGGSVLPVSNFLESQSFCEVREWKKFTLVSPAAGQWTSGTVEFDDSAGAALSGLSVQNIGQDGTIDLSSLGLQSRSDFSKLRVKLVGAATPTIDVKMTWTAEWHPECVVRGQTALTTTTVTSSTTASTSTSTVAPALTTSTVAGRISVASVNGPGEIVGKSDLPSSGTGTDAWLRYALMTVALGAFAIALGLEHRDSAYRA